MPGYKRKRTSRRPTRRTRRRIFRAPRPIRSNNRHMFKRSVELDPKYGVSNSQVNLMWAFTGSLSDLPNFSEFTNLYDQYRINKIKYTICPNFTGVDMLNLPANTGDGPDLLGQSPIATVGLPNIHTVVDYDSTDMSGYNVGKMMQYSTYKRSRGNREHSRYWTPCILHGEYKSPTLGGTAYAGTKAKQWLDCSYADIPHYGLKVLVDPMPRFFNQTSGNFSVNPHTLLRCYVTFYFECRGVR